LSIGENHGTVLEHVLMLISEMAVFHNHDEYAQCQSMVTTTQCFIVNRIYNFKLPVTHKCIN